MTEKSGGTVEFGSVMIPHDWGVDPQGKYAQTTKERALEYFNSSDWEPISLQQAAIEVQRNGVRIDRDVMGVEIFKKTGQVLGNIQLGSDLGRRKSVFFVTGGWQEYFWNSAKNVTIQEIKSVEQVKSEFSGDVPEGRFFMRRVK